MAITRKDVEIVARLARLALTEDEKQMFAGQLEKILAYIEKLKEIDTANVPPTAHPFSSKTSWREDLANPWKGTESILENAPEREESYFKVKKVIE